MVTELTNYHSLFRCFPSWRSLIDINGSLKKIFVYVHYCIVILGQIVTKKNFMLISIELMKSYVCLWEITLYTIILITVMTLLFVESENITITCLKLYSHNVVVRFC